METEAIVYVVDDDLAVLTSLRWLLESAHLRVKTYASGAAFLADYDASNTGCLVLDVRMPGLNGLEVQQRIAELGTRLPIIIMTGHGDVPTCTKAFKAGAFDFIEKPADDELLLDQIQRAIAADAQYRRLGFPGRSAAPPLVELSPREQEVMDLIVAGKTQKQIAVALGISIQTVAKHRGKVLEKLEVDNDVELARLALAAGAAFA